MVQPVVLAIAHDSILPKGVSTEFVLIDKRYCYPSFIYAQDSLFLSKQLLCMQFAGSFW